MGEARSVKSRHILEALALGAIWFCLVIVLVPPWGNFPISDDWAYAHSVRWLLDSHRIIISPFSAPARISNILWGALFCLPGGFSYTALRISSLAAGSAAVGAMFLLLTETGIERRSAIFGALALAWFPLFFIANFNFFTDTVFLAAVSLACWSFMRGLESGDALPLWIGAGFCSIAYLSREIGIAPAAALALFLFLKKRAAADRFIPLLLPIVVMLAHQCWLRFNHGVTYGMWWHRHESVLLLHSPIRLGWLIINRATVSIEYLGLLLFPVAAGSIPGLLRGGISRPQRNAIMIGIFLLALAWISMGPLPRLGDQMTPLGLGSISMPGGALKPAGWWDSRVFWLAVNAASLAGAVVLFIELSRMPRIVFYPVAALALTFLPALGGFVFFDRYCLVLAPAAVLIAARRLTPNIPALLALAAVAIPAWAGARDDLSWNRAVWDAGIEAEALGCPAKETMGGLAWDGEHIAEDNIRALLARKPKELIRPFEWRDMNRFRCQLSFSPQPPGRGMILAGEQEYRSPLTGGGRIFIYRTARP